MRRLLWIGDAACPSGFAKATHACCDYLDARSNPENRNAWLVTVLGINYRGDPHDYAYPIYAAPVSGDGFGVLRTVFMCDTVKPDVIVIQQDPWNIPAYRFILKGTEYEETPMVGFLAVDGLNCRGDSLTGLAHAVFYTQFGAAQARLGGYAGPSSVVPLGVDHLRYCPGDRTAARVRRGLPRALAEQAFIVGNINRNQPRKRLDLTLRYFALWWRAAGRPEHAYLWLHVAPTGEEAYDIKQLARFYGIYDQMIVMEPPVWYGSSEDVMVDSYRSFDVQITTTQGEGDGLTTKEGMACGIPQIVPDWSALGEWAQMGALRIPCSTTAATAGDINALGGIPDEEPFVAALDGLWRHAEARSTLGRQGRALMAQPQFRWSAVGAGVAAALETVMAEGKDEEADGERDVGREGNGRDAETDRRRVAG